MLRYILFAFMIVLGILLGNYYATEVNPVDVVDAPPTMLRMDYKTDYVLMVAEVYADEQNPALAARQLALLGSDHPSVIITEALASALDLGYTAEDLLLMRDLSNDMATWNTSLEGEN